MPLREYQQDAVHELRAAIQRHGSAVYCLPTGGGKTVVAGEIARLAAEKGSRTFFLVHRRELVKQAVDTLLEAVPGVSIGVECPGWPQMPWAPLQVGMVQSVARRQRVAKPDLVIIDEAHHARAKTWETVLGRWPDARRIGLTATPQRLDGKGLGEHFSESYLDLRSLNLSPMEAWRLVEHCVSQVHSNWKGLEPTDRASTGPTKSENESQGR